MKDTATIILALIVALNFHGVAPAHDFWIEPSSYRLEPNSLVQIALRVGERFDRGEPVVRNASRIERFVVIGPGGEQPVIGKDGADPAGVIRPEQPGLYTVVYRNVPSRIELEAEKFEAYLREEGLDAIITSRRDRGESAKPGKEQYSRCAKSLLWAGSGPAKGFQKPVGLPLELVPDKNPYKLGSGEELPVRLLLDGKPVQDALIVAVPRGAPDRKLSARTGTDGRASFKLEPGGAWLINCVHMARAPAGAEVDWISLWASLSFERGDRPRPIAVAPAASSP